MEFYGKRKTLNSFMDEERKEIQFSPASIDHRLPSIKTHHQYYEPDLQFSPARPSTTSNPMISIIPPPSPDSPWILSPVQTPSPSLLYHCIASLHRQEGNIYSIAVSKEVVFTSSESRKIRAWRQPDCVERGCIKASNGEVRAMLAYGNMLFTSHKDHKVRMWNFVVSDNLGFKKVATLPKRSTFQLLFSRTTNANHHHHQQHHHHHKDCVPCMAYNHAEGLLYTASWDKTVKAWRVSDKRCVDSFLAHEDRVNAIVVNQEDGCVFTGSSDGCVKIWRRVYNESSHNLTMTLKFQPSPVNALALSSSLNNTFLYSGASDGFITFWEKEKMSGRFNHGGFLQGHRFSVLCLVALEKLIFSGSEDTTIRVWKREEDSCFHECLAVLDGHRGPVRCLAACLEVEKIVKGFLVYSASLDQSFKVWRVKVMPEEKNKMCNHENYNNNNGRTADSKTNKMMMMDYEMSPVLSPSWVEKKLQGGDQNFH